MTATTIALIALLIVLAVLAYVALTRQNRKNRASKPVNAECLVCPYLETCEDLTAARKAGNEHAAAAGHPLMLVHA